MRRRVRDYTAIGKRIAALARGQRELGRVLGISQQTISKKLRGETAILLSDLEKFARHYGVSLCYFFDEPDYSPELAVAWERILAMSTDTHDLMYLVSQLPESDVRTLLEMAKVLVEG